MVRPSAHVYPNIVVHHQAVAQNACQAANVHQINRVSIKNVWILVRELVVSVQNVV